MLQVSHGYIYHCGDSQERINDAYLHILSFYSSSNYIFKLSNIFFFLIGKQKTIIKEKLERVQVVHDDEQLEKRTKSTTKEAIRKLS